MNELNNSFLSNRLKHISFYIKRSIGSLLYDPILRQMDRHTISSKYIEDRIVELFFQMLTNEREEYISQIEQEVRTAKEAKKSLWESLTLEVAKNERKLQTSYDENLQLLRQVNTLQSIVDTNTWKEDRVKESSMKKIQTIDRKIASFSPVLYDLHQNASTARHAISNLRKKVADIQNEFNASLKDARIQINKRLDDIFNDENISVEIGKSRSQGMKIKRWNESIKTSMIALLAHINNKYQIGQRPLSMNNIDKDFPSVIEDICKPFPVDSDMRKASYICCKIENDTAEIELEWTEKVHAQQMKLKKLQMELTNVEKRLKQLLDTDSTIDPRLLKELENHHSSYSKTVRNKTDQMMEMVLGQSSSYNSDIESNISNSPTPKNNQE